MSDQAVSGRPEPHRIDAQGRLCPLPIIDLARAARDIARAGGGGELIELLADDPAAATDVPAWCAMRGHDLLEATPPRYLIRLGSPS